MPETSHHRHRTHRRSGKSKGKLRWVDALLLLWSVASLVSFFYLIDKVESAPVWQIIALAASTLLGLILFFRLAMQSKK